MNDDCDCRNPLNITVSIEGGIYSVPACTCCPSGPCECGNRCAMATPASLIEETPDGPITLASGHIFGDRFEGIAPPDEL